MKPRLCIALCLLLLAFLPTVLKAQRDTGKIREAGLGFSNLNSFSIAYQWGTPKTIYSFSVMSFSLSAPKNSSNNGDDTNTISNSTSNGVNINFSLAFSITKAKRLSPKLDFLHGGIIGTGFGYMHNNSSDYSGSGPVLTSSYSSKNTTYSYTPFVGIVLGLRYAISNLFYVYAEVSPRIYYTYSKATSTSTDIISQSVNTSQSIEQTPGISNLSNSGASLMLVYRFQK